MRGSICRPCRHLRLSLLQPLDAGPQGRTHDGVVRCTSKLLLAISERYLKRINDDDLQKITPGSPPITKATGNGIGGFSDDGFDAELVHFMVM